MTYDEIKKALERCTDGTGKGIIQAALDLINRLQEENDTLDYKLVGVMHFVDKWLDGAELEQDEVSRANTMREKTLQTVENLEAEIKMLRKAVEIHKGIAEDWKYEAKRLQEMVGEDNAY